MAHIEWYYGRRELNSILAHMAKGEVHDKGRDVEHLAEANLETARATTHWHKIHPETSPEHATTVTGGAATDHDEDYLVHLNGNNALALEYGHSPSGVFGPGGELGHLNTKAPEGLYILGRASGLAG